MKRAIVYLQITKPNIDQDFKPLIYLQGSGTYYCQTIH